jgi:hypothetical protein
MTGSKSARSEQQEFKRGVMPGLVPGIHVLLSSITKDVDGRDNGVPADFVGGVPPTLP